MDWTSAQITLWLSVGTTVVLLMIGLPLAAWMATTRSRLRHLVNLCVAIPLALPPTVLGFYLLQGFGPHGFVGKLWNTLFGGSLAFTFTGILMASVISNFPFAVRPFTAAISSVDRRFVEAAWCLGASRWKTYLQVTLPLAWRGIVAGIVLTFAHTVGEFGVILMVGGNIPGLTRTLSMTVYDDVQALQYMSAAASAQWLLGFAIVSLGLLQLLERRGGRHE